MTRPQSVKVFKGLNNTADPLQMGLSWLTQADDVVVNEFGRLSTREGFSRVATGSYSGAYSTRDHQRLFVVDTGALKERDLHTGAFEPLLLGLDPERQTRFAEINRQVYFNNGVDAGVIEPDGSVLPLRFSPPPAPELSAAPGRLPAGLYRVCCSYLLDDGRETGSGEVSEIELPEGSSLVLGSIPLTEGAQTLVYLAPANSTVFQFALAADSPNATWNAPADALGPEPRSFGMSGLPEEAESIAFFQGRLCAQQTLPGGESSVVWLSQPLAFHLFDFNDYLAVPGRGVWIAEHDKALIIATDAGFWAWDGEALARLAHFGAAPGDSLARDEDGRLFFITQRGPYSALPFEPLAPQFSMPVGARAGGGLVESEGGKRYIVSLHAGGSSFNARDGA